MPEPDRDEVAVLTAGTDETRAEDVGALRRRALAVLLDPSLVHVVDLVAWRDGESVHVADVEGESRFSVADPAAPQEVVRGRDPVALQDPMIERDDCYPFAGPRLVDLFAEERAPDIAVVHTGAHYWPDRGGHLGEHGSLNAVQSRAPLLLSGAGVTSRGVLARAARTPDVGATLCRVLGAPTDGMAGEPLADLVEPGARYVVGLLWDGAPSRDLLAGAADGTLPNVARLLERGCALEGGAVAEFPSVTLVNHTSALTGVGPGGHGVVHNAYYDRETKARTVPNDASTWHRAAEWLRPGVRTVFERLAEVRPDAVSACVDEPTDRGATVSTFGLVRAAREAAEQDGAGGGSGGSTTSLVDSLPDPRGDSNATAEHLGNEHYAWSSRVDGGGLTQVLGLYGQPDPPAFLWWNSLLTDTGHHEGGPGSAIARASLTDTDRRLGAFLDLLDERGLLDETTILLTADHGSQGADPECLGDWDEPLKRAGIPFRDEGYGFLYLGADVLD